MLTTADIAELLQLSAAWVREQCESGEIPAHKVGRHWRVDADDFDAWRERQRYRPPARITFEPPAASARRSARSQSDLLMQRAMANKRRDEAQQKNPEG